MVTLVHKPKQTNKTLQIKEENIILPEILKNQQMPKVDYLKEQRELRKNKSTLIKRPRRPKVSRENEMGKILSTGSQDDSGFNQYQLDLHHEELSKLDQLKTDGDPLNINIETGVQNSQRHRFDSPKEGNQIGILLTNQSPDTLKPRH